MNVLLACAVGSAFVLGPGMAWGQGAPTVERVTGTVVLIAGDDLTLKLRDGATAKIALLPGWRAFVATPVTMQDIKPGSYIGTTNYAKPDGTGRSLEVHVSPPGATGPGVDFVMDQKAGTTMTNGIVGTIVEGKSARVASVNYGFGVRTITIPANVPIVLNTPGEHDAVKPGQKAKVSTFTRPTGEKAQIVAVGPGAWTP
jgi:hypothetical protein